jgi:hypothetical protein
MKEFEMSDTFNDTNEEYVVDEPLFDDGEGPDYEVSGCDDDYDDSMDGDFDSAMASAGWGTDEDYNGWESEPSFDE